MSGASDDDRAIRRIETELAKLGAELSPRPGWQARVLAEIEQAEARPKRRWWWYALPAVGAVAAAAVAVVVLRGPGREEPARPLEIAYEVRKDPAAVRRGDSAVLGDTIVVTAKGGRAHRAVWIYREERELVMACPGAAGCSSADGAEIATLKLGSIGTYQLVAWSSDAPIPAPTGSYADAAAAAVEAGAEEAKRKLLVE